MKFQYCNSKSAQTGLWSDNVFSISMISPSSTFIFGRLKMMWSITSPLPASFGSNAVHNLVFTYLHIQIILVLVIYFKNSCNSFNSSTPIRPTSAFFNSVQTAFRCSGVRLGVFQNLRIYPSFLAFSEKFLS